MRRAKIVCTLGPATASYEAIRALVEAGMDVARLNFSHGDRARHLEIYRHVRRASDESGHAVGVLADLQGPKIRLGTFASGPATLVAGATFTLTTEEVPGDATRASTTYAALPGDVHAGDAILIDDGNVRLRVESVDGVRIACTVIEGGVVSDHKGINLPGVRVSAASLSPKDRDDLAFALSLRVDLIALSFVRSPDDVRDVHAVMDANGGRLPVIAKIEKPEAVARLDDVVRAFDGVMVARGDLGVEIPLEQVPLVQKRAIRLAREAAKPVIVATQMLESMITHSRPTRAEASDVANAVLDGADALMLSGETSVGAHPVETVQTMARIITAAEQQALESRAGVARRRESRGDAIAAAAVRIAEDTSARALVAFTTSGASARSVSSHRPAMPLLAFTSEPAVRSQLALQWGIETFVVPSADSTDAMVHQVERALLDLGRAAAGELVVIVAGTPPGRSGSTNTVRVHKLAGD
ncbi:MAG TPA: pyruvate kinase [Candidatus Acidoferrales bacterium]|nr:pyruvate kinase [Candidatus Acidoferrales bacterium]